MLALSGTGDTISAILRTTINHLSTPDELRGRMSSINSISQPAVRNSVSSSPAWSPAGSARSYRR
jgi:hypothetical protein